MSKEQTQKLIYVALTYWLSAKVEFFHLIQSLPRSGSKIDMTELQSSQHLSSHSVDDCKVSRPQLKTQLQENIVDMNFVDQQVSTNLISYVERKLKMNL